MAKVHVDAKTPETEMAAPVAAATNGNAVTTTMDRMQALALLEEHSSTGFEDVVAGDLALPQFKLLQSGSPQVKRTEADYVRGAREGLWLDVISRRMFSEVTFIPCKFSTHYIEWDIEARGNIIANHGTDRSLYDQCHRDESTGQDITPNKKGVIVPTATWFGLVIEGNEIDPNVVEDKGTHAEMLARAVITMSGTAQRVSRRWVSDAQSIQLKNAAGNFFRPPLFAMSYILGSSATKNDDGSWFLPTVARGGWTLDYPNGAMLFDKAAEFAKFANEMQSQLIVVNKSDSPMQQETRTDSRRSSENYSDKPLDEDIPF